MTHAPEPAIVKASTPSSPARWSAFLTDIRLRWPQSLTSPGVLVGIVLMASLLKYGVGLHPEWTRLYSIAEAWPDPTQAAPIMETDGSLLSNLTAPWLLGAVGARTPLAYLLGSLALILIAIALPLVMPAVRTSRNARRLAFVFVLGGAVPAVLLGWVGGYDAAIVIAMVVAVLARQRWLAAVGWFALAFSHAALGLLAFAFWVPMALATAPRTSWREVARGIALAGASGLAGWLTIRWLTDGWGGSIDRWSLYRAIDPGDVWSAYLANLPLTVFSVLGIGWFVLLHPQVRSTLAARVLLGEAVVAALVVPLIAVDHTRIAALTLFSAVLAWVAGAAPSLPPRTVSTLWRVLAIPAVVLPVIVIWMGEPLVDAWPGVAELLLAVRS